MKSLVLLRGLPGSGKTSFGNFIKNLIPEDTESFSDEDFDFIDYENFFINPLDGSMNFNPEMLKDSFEWCINECRIAMVKNKKGIMVSYYFIQDKEMDVYYEMAKNYGYRVFSLVVESKHQGSSDKGLGEDVIQRMRKKFDVNL